MKFNGNPSTDLGLEYHSFSESERDGKLVTRYTLSTPVDSEKEAELSKYDNVKLVRNGASHRYAPEIRYDVLYVAEDPRYEEPVENNPTADYLDAGEGLDEYEVNEKLNSEIIDKNENTFEDIGKYASVTSAMAEVNNQILLYRSMAENLISECEVQLGKLSSLVSTPETSENMEKGLEEGRVLSGELTANESFEDEHLGYVEDHDWDNDERFSKVREIVFDRIKNSEVLTDSDKKEFFDEIKFESLAEFLGFYSGEFDPEEVLSSPEKMEEIADDYLSYLENQESGFGGEN